MRITINLSQSGNAALENPKLRLFQKPELLSDWIELQLNNNIFNQM